MQCFSGVFKRSFVGILVYGRSCGSGFYRYTRAFLEYMDIDPLKFASAPGPFGDRGGICPSWHLGADGGVCCTPYIRRRSLYSDGPLSSRPQPLGSGGDAAPCEDTREDLGLSL